QLKPNERELMAAIAALGDVSPDEQEAACRALQEHHGVEAVARARALLSVEKRAAEVTAEVDGAARTRDVESEKQQAAMELVEFHESDFAPQLAHPPTVKQQQEMLESLADLWDSDPIEYAKRKRESAGRLDVSEPIVEEAVKRIRAERK